MSFIRTVATLFFLLFAVSVAHAATPQEKLFEAVNAGDAAGVQSAIKAGAKINQKNPDGWPALLMAAYDGKLDVVKVLLAAGADVNGASDNGETPLMGAAMSGSEEIARLLLSKGAKKTAKTKKGFTAAEIAERKGHAQLAMLLGKEQVAGAKGGSIPDAPIGELVKIMLPSGITLYDWIGIADKRIEKGEEEAVLAEGGQYLVQYGPHKELLRTLDEATDRFVTGMLISEKAEAQAAIPRLEKALVGGRWPPKLLLKLGYAYHVAEDFVKAKDIYARWLMSAAPDNPERAKVLELQMMVAEGKLPKKSDMVFVKGGCFDMGDTFGDGESDEKPVHQVCVDDFYIGRYEVTEKEWRDVMGKLPRFSMECDNCPVQEVSWNDVQDFINRLNAKAEAKYRLPTEAEWEYAARSGGKREKWAGTSNESELGDYAWYRSNSDSEANPVGQKKPNGLAIYDMSGNVSEWVQDWSDSSFHYFRVFRGGGCYSEPKDARSSYRGGFTPDYRNGDLGFRLVRTR